MKIVDADHMKEIAQKIIEESGDECGFWKAFIEIIDSTPSENQLLRFIAVLSSMVGFLFGLIFAWGR